MNGCVPYTCTVKAKLDPNRYYILRKLFTTEINILMIYYDLRKYTYIRNSNLLLLKPNAVNPF